MPVGYRRLSFTTARQTRRRARHACAQFTSEEADEGLSVLSHLRESEQSSIRAAGTQPATPPTKTAVERAESMQEQGADANQPAQRWHAKAPQGAALDRTTKFLCPRAFQRATYRPRSIPGEEAPILGVRWTFATLDIGH
jgi:hypothetical protein